MSDRQVKQDKQNKQNKKYAALCDALTSAEIRWEAEVTLAKHTTFHIGGAADLGIFPGDSAECIRAITLCGEHHIPYTLLGCGSNTLASDEGYRGAVLFTTSMATLTVSGTHIYAGAGVPLTRCACAARDAGLFGLAFAYGIPGSVGGAVYMNAGAYEGEMRQVVESVTVYDPQDGEIHTLSASDCGFDYRTSCFQHEGQVILSVALSLSPGDKETIRLEMEDYMSRRRARQPLEYPSAGSVFKRYPGYFTAKLIDEAGLKGYQIGGARVSEKHAGFIINCGGATAADVRALILQIQEEIFRLHGIHIEPEIKELG